MVCISRYLKWTNNDPCLFFFLIHFFSLFIIFLSSQRRSGTQRIEHLADCNRESMKEGRETGLSSRCICEGEKTRPIGRAEALRTR